MISISIHGFSLLIGIIIGVCICMVALMSDYWTQQWNVGFSQGWDCGMKYREQEAKRGNSKDDVSGVREET